MMWAKVYIIMLRYTKSYCKVKKFGITNSAFSSAPSLTTILESSGIIFFEQYAIKVSLSLRWSEYFSIWTYSKIFKAAQHWNSFEEVTKLFATRNSFSEACLEDLVDVRLGTDWISFLDNDLHQIALPNINETYQNGKWLAVYSIHFSSVWNFCWKWNFGITLFKQFTPIRFPSHTEQLSPHFIF